MVESELDGGFGLPSIACLASDKVFARSPVTVPLALDNASAEDNAFEIEDREVVIVQSFRRRETT